MKAPFTIGQFLDVFKNYNLSVWPAQIVFYLLAMLSIVLLFKSARASDKIITAILSLLWIWMGVVYHLIYFTAINKAAYVFGVAFVVQGLLLAYSGIVKRKMEFGSNKGIYGITGGILILYALVIYPLLGYMQGRIYPSTPTFGLPCPTTIFTFGMLLFAGKKLPLYVLAIPLVWSVIGTSAAVNFGIKEDIGLILSGIVGTLLIVIRKRTKAITV